MACGQRRGFIEQIHRVQVHAILHALRAKRLTGERQLLRQIGDGDAHVGIKLRALHRPPAGVAAYVEQALRLIREHDGQRSRKRLIGIVMIKGEPAIARLRGQRGQTFVESVPVAERLQTGGLALLQRLIEIEQAAVTNLVDHIHVDAGHRIAEQKITELGQCVAPVIQAEHARAEAGFQQHFQTVARQRNLFRHVVERQSLAAFLHQFQHAALAENATGLKNHRRKGDALRLGLGIEGGL